jgi:hypothetical protein
LLLLLVVMLLLSAMKHVEQVFKSCQGTRSLKKKKKSH